MSAKPKSTGAEILVERNKLAQERQGLARYKDIVAIEDEKLDGDRIQATLRKMLGYEDVEVRMARTLTSGLDLMLARKPDLVLLDDYIGLVDRAHDALPMIWRTGFDGPIVVISGKLNRERQNELLKRGVAAAIHKDEVCSGTLSRVMLDLADTLKAIAAKA